MRKQSILKWFTGVYIVVGLALILGAFLLVRISKQEKTQLTEQALVITKQKEVDGAVGKIVKLIGIVSTKAKPAELLGVEIEDALTSLHRKYAQATGLLLREVITEEEFNRRCAEKGFCPAAEIGTFYRLVDPITKELAQVTPAQFSTLDEYLKLLNEPATAIPYYVKAIPQGFIRVQTGSAKKGLPLYIEGFEKPVYVLALPDWSAPQTPEPQQFYLEIVGPIDCLIDPECPNPDEPFRYGPFQGNLKELLK